MFDQSLTDFIDRSVDRVIYDLIPISMHELDFILSDPKTPRNHLFILCFSSPQSRLKRVEPTGVDKNGDGFEIALLKNRHGSLHVDLQNNPKPLV